MTAIMVACSSRLLVLLLIMIIIGLLVCAAVSMRMQIAAGDKPVSLPARLSTTRSTESLIEHCMLV
jgi:hypothetical protein